MPCRLQTPRLAERMRAAQRESIITHKVLLPATTRLTNADRLKIVDAVSGLTRILMVHAATNPQESHLHCVALCEEQEG